jgi:hypothetical protein
MPEIFIRGNTLKYIRIPDEVRRKQLSSRGQLSLHMPVWAISKQQQMRQHRQVDSAVACQPGAFHACLGRTMAYSTRRIAHPGPHRNACTTSFGGSA